MQFMCTYLININSQEIRIYEKLVVLKVSHKDLAYMGHDTSYRIS